MNKLIVPWEKSVVLGCLFLLVTVMAVGAYVGIKEEGRAFNPVYQEQKTAGPMVNRAVGAAMEKYLDSADSSVSRVRIYSTTVNGDGAVTAIVYVSRLGCGGMQDDDSNPHEMTLAPMRHPGMNMWCRRTMCSIPRTMTCRNFSRSMPSTPAMMAGFRDAVSGGSGVSSRGRRESAACGCGPIPLAPRAAR